MPSNLLPAATAVLAWLSPLAAQVTVTLPCEQDNTLYEDPAGLLSSGAGDSLFVGVTGQLVNNRRRAVLQFDVAGAVPAGAYIVTAALSIRTIQSAFAGTVDVSGHRVLQAWGEGTSVAPGGGGSGGAATIGDATWLHTQFPTALWTLPGGDFVPTPSLTLATQPFGVVTSPASAALTADVQLWLDNPGANHGWLLKSAELQPSRARKIDSREAVNGVPPALTITYLLPSQTTTFGAGCPVGPGSFQFSLNGPAIGGTTGSFVQSGGPANQLAVNLLSLGFDADGFQLLPGCKLYLPLGPGLVSHSIVTLDATGAATTGVSYPAGFPGVELFAQSAALHSGPSGYVLSNAAIASLQ